ncbi:putative glycolipid-binding domain-containing protein [uncultured Brevibacillus sp.]|uniref:putative glycolipid-binding domain-containing protein n=1 Tax=uncultured Brevibacillus sp. TaxID=169970 RepID=UPI002594E5D8|nr:putative glycolipid-binding domain-containing protein [uncultured Brevibacillus sp.]
MDVVWRPSTGIGLEHLKLREEKQQIHVDSIVVGSVNGDGIERIKYEIVLDKSWVTSEVKISNLGDSQKLS